MGTSSEMQKQVAIDTMERLSQSIPIVGEFVGTMGLPVILDNLNIRGIDHLKELSTQFLQMKQQQAEAASQQPSEVEILANTEKEIEMTRIEQQREKAQLEAANKSAQLAIEREKVDLQFLELMSKVKQSEVKSAIEAEKLASQQSKDSVELAIEMIKSTRE